MSTSTNRIQPKLDIRGLLAVGISLGLLFFPSIAPPAGRWWEAGWNALHVPGFFLITWGIEHLLAAVVPQRGKRVALAALGALIIAIGSEVAHDALGRSSSMGDFWRDLIGTGFAVVVLLVAPKCGSKGRLGLIGVAVVLVAVLFLPTLKDTLAAREHRKLFPNLAGFETQACLAVWKPQGNTIVELVPGESELIVRIGPGWYGGVSFSPSMPNWQGYETLHLEIENPGEPFEMGVRIDDVLTAKSPGRTRWEEGREIPTGRFEIRLSLADVMAGPKERLLDLGKIYRMALYTGDENTGRIFFIKSAFLE